MFKLSSETKVTARDKNHSEAVLTLAITLWGPSEAVPQPSAARCDPTPGDTEHPEAWAVHRGERAGCGLKKHHLVCGGKLPSPGQGKIREEKQCEVILHHTHPCNLLTHVDFILMHRWAVVWSKASAWAVRGEQKSSQGLKGALGHCSV